MAIKIPEVTKPEDAANAAILHLIRTESSEAEFEYRRFFITIRTGENERQIVARFQKAAGGGQ